MPDFAEPLKPVKIETELGSIFVHLNGWGVTVHAPHLTVDGMPLQASATLVSSNRLNWDLVRTWDPNTSQLTAGHGIQAKLVDGRDADIIVLGKVAQVIVPAVGRLAETNPGIFLEAERRRIMAEIRGFEHQIENIREKIKIKEAELAAIEAKLPDR